MAGHPDADPCRLSPVFALRVGPCVHQCHYIRVRRNEPPRAPVLTVHSLPPSLQPDRHRGATCIPEPGYVIHPPRSLEGDRERVTLGQAFQERPARWNLKCATVPEGRRVASARPHKNSPAGVLPLDARSTSFSAPKAQESGHRRRQSVPPFVVNIPTPLPGGSKTLCLTGVLGVVIPYNISDASTLSFWMSPGML